MDRAFTIRIYFRNFITNQNRDISRIPILVRHGCAKFVKRSTNCNIPINTCIFITQLNSLKPLLTIRLSDQRIARTSCMSYNGDKVKKKKKKGRKHEADSGSICHRSVPFLFYYLIYIYV